MTHSVDMQRLLSDAFDFVLVVIHLDGVNQGIKGYFDLPDFPPTYSHVHWYYSVYHGCLDLHIDMGEGAHRKTRLIGQREYLSGDWDFSAIDTMILKMLPGINKHESRSIRPCENVECVQLSGRRFPVPDGLPWARYVGDRWVCYHCRTAYSLSPEIVTEREPQNVSDERAKLTGALRFKVLERDGYKCRACGRNPRDHDVVLHIDHIMPIAKGGKTELDNLQVLCSDCNIAKSDSISKQMGLW